MPPSVFFVHTYYPEFTSDLYRRSPQLTDLEFAQQHRRIIDKGFGNWDSYAHYLGTLGWRVSTCVVNADVLQNRWATEHDLELTGNIHDQRRQIVAAQIAEFQPDVLYVFEWSPLGDEFLAELKSQVKLLAGQVASPLRTDRSYGAYDLMISSWPPIVDWFRGEGIDAEYVKMAFDPRVLERLGSATLTYDVTFVGGFAPSHPDRISWLEHLLGEVEVDIFGYGAEKTRPDSLIRKHHRGGAWGWRMYEVLSQSRITLNRHAHIEVGGYVATNVANNMRLFEATGMGTCLLTDEKENLCDLFDTDREIVTYRDQRECVEKIRALLADDSWRKSVAAAGQRRTLQDHGYDSRAVELDQLLRGKL